MAELSLRVASPTGPLRAAALVLHGGRVHSPRPVQRWHLAAVRMLPFAAALRRHAGNHGLAVAVLRYRARGWNAADGPDPAPVSDVLEALGQLRAHLGEVPLALIGHSMGGRAALHTAAHPSVRAVVALAPWLTSADRVAPLAGRDLFVVHGLADRTTDPAASQRFADAAERAGARASFVGLTGEHHAMLRRARLWHDLCADYVAAVLLGVTASGRAAAISEQAVHGGVRATL